MSTDKRIFDDLARLAGGAVDALGAVRQEVEARAKGQVESMLQRMDVPTREEFDAATAMASHARAVGEDLAVKIAELEARLAALEARLPAPAPNGE